MYYYNNCFCPHTSQPEPQILRQQNFIQMTPQGTFPDNTRAFTARHPFQIKVGNSGPFDAILWLHLTGSTQKPKVYITVKPNQYFTLRNTYPPGNYTISLNCQSPYPQYEIGMGCNGYVQVVEV